MAYDRRNWIENARANLEHAVRAMESAEYHIVAFFVNSRVIVERDALPALERIPVGEPEFSDD